MSNDDSKVKLAFERDCVVLPLDCLNASVPLPPQVKSTAKYSQIRASVKAIGLVEPIVVFQNAGRPGVFQVLDGRLRLEALKDLGESNALCLISTDDEAYTYNRRVSRLSAIQEHRMISKAAQSGVSTKALSLALDLSEDTVRSRFRLLDGICSEAVRLLADKPVPHGLFKVLRQVKPFRQIDIAQAMINLNNFSLKLAGAMLQATAAELLTEEVAARSVKSGPTEALQRLERELAALQEDTKLLEESYGPANLQLEIIKTYLSKTLLNNAAVVRWLARTRSEYLEQLQMIAELKKLPA